MSNTSKLKDEVTLANELFGKKPRPEIRNRVLDLFKNLSLEAQLDLEKPPLINKFADLLAWQKATENIFPPEELDNIYLYPIRQDEKVLQFVGFAKIEVPNEEHDDMIESFFILDGSCRCQIGEHFFEYQTGDFFEIPLYTFHNLKVTSEKPVKAILQRILL